MLLRIPSRAISIFQELMKLKGDKFSAILKIIKELSPTLKISIISEKISETLKMSRLDAVTIMQTLIDLSGIYFSYDAKIDDFLQSLNDAIMQAKTGSEIDINFKKFIKELLESPEFALKEHPLRSGKALRGARNS